MPRYLPPTRVPSIEMPYQALVVQADPDIERLKRNEIEYEFSGRSFRADPTQRGAYNSHDNVYPVGQPYGEDDPEVVAARPLYSGVPTGSWA
jgi:hypothetical protein